MLPRSARLTRSVDFGRTVRGGRRAGSELLVVHVLAGQRVETAEPYASQESARVGFVVSRAVGGAVVRNRVRRRLQAVAAERLIRLPTGGMVVVRALPRSAIASYDDLAAAFDRAVTRAAAGEQVR